MFSFKSPHLVLGLSPMDGVTDTVMRQITKKFGGVDLLTTEFVNVEGLHFAKARLERELHFSPEEQPLLAQIYGLTPAYFAEATQLAWTLGFTGVDLNFGCPAKSVVHSGAGAALINEPQKVMAIYTAVWDKVRTLAATKKRRERLSVSIKTRLGYEHEQVIPWFSFLLQLQPQPDLITVHGRTLKQGYQGTANWQAIKQVVTLKQQLAPNVAIYGNGDVTSLALAQQRARVSGVDGVVIGRAALGNPWVFRPRTTAPTFAERAQVALAHAQLFEQTYGEQTNYHFAPMRKYLAAYVKGLPQATSLRAKLVRADSSAQVAQIFAQN